MLSVVITLNIKVMEMKTKFYFLNIVLIKLNLIKCLIDLTDSHKTQDKWKPQLTMTFNFIFSKDSNETRFMHTKSDNIEAMVVNVEQMKLLKNVLILFYKDIKRS